MKGADLAKSSSKIATEHEKLRKDLTKEIENSKALKIKMAGLETTLNEKDDTIAQLEQRLQEAESRAPNLEGLDSKQWKSAVATRMLEQKLKSMEGELEKKVCLEDNIGYILSSLEIRIISYWIANQFLYLKNRQVCEKCSPCTVFLKFYLLMVQQYGWALRRIDDVGSFVMPKINCLT